MSNKRKKAPAGPSNLLLLTVGSTEKTISLHPDSTLSIVSASTPLNPTRSEEPTQLYMNGSVLCILTKPSPTVTFGGALKLRGPGELVFKCTSPNNPLINLVDLVIVTESLVSLGEDKKEEELERDVIEVEKGYERGKKGAAEDRDSAENATLDTGTLQQQPSSKKARKKEAKRKQEELAETLREAREKSGGEGDAKKRKGSSYDDKADEAEATPLSTRRLEKGVVVRDFIIGGGGEIRNGGMVGINYEGTLPDVEGTPTFDKNQSRTNPLTFRLGCGNVIKGLEVGLKGMKVGGEREIRIPPNMGYGKKKNGKIPPGSTLMFYVKLVSLG